MLSRDQSKRMADSDTSSASGENNNIESGKEEQASSPVKQTSKKTESWPRFSYTGSLGGTLQVFHQ